MKRCAVLGSPIKHSLSPVIHRTAYGLCGLDWRFDAIDVTVGNLGEFLSTCGPQWVGLALTMPLKTEVIRCGRPSARVTMLNAANTLVFGQDGAAHRIENTDVDGFVGPLSRVVENPRTGTIVGAGATARSALAALAELGVTSVDVVARDSAKAVVSMMPIATALGVEARTDGWAVPDRDADVLISTVPAGLDAAFMSELAERSSVVFDVRYGAGPSQFEGPARSSGAQLIDGLAMLVGQAVVQVKLMTGFDIPEEPLLEVARAELARRH